MPTSGVVTMVIHRHDPCEVTSPSQANSEPDSPSRVSAITISITLVNSYLSFLINQLARIASHSVGCVKAQSHCQSRVV